MARRLKYRPGPEINDIHLLVDLLELDVWVYWRDKPKHPRVLRNMSLTVLDGACRRGGIRLALPAIPLELENITI